jgi:hypothetical protein
MRVSILATVVAMLALGGCDGSTEVSRSVGARCDANEECNNRCLSGRAYPDGFCTISCDSDGDCPGSTRCVEAEGGVCLFGCVETADCEFLGAGWDCTDLAPRPANQQMQDVKACRAD